ncbi:MAG: DUF1178 family protein [Alphaproteobacteria bacterium]|nr:DUF1178 family protein [Alphaproteobacteria bacterium]
MIRYTLKCDKDHSFDSWFQTAAAFDKLKSAGLVACAVCGSDEVEKAIMAPRVRPARSASKNSQVGTLSQPASPAEQAVAEMRAKIEAKSEDVGDNFADEARAIHEGEAPKRAIIGEATPEAAKSLIDDGIPVAPLPWSSRKTN